MGLPMHYILESNFRRIFLFLELTLQRETFTSIYISLHDLHTLFLLFLSPFNNNFILIVHSKQCVQSRRTRSVLKIERYAQRLTQEASSYSWARGFERLRRVVGSNLI